MPSASEVRPGPVMELCLRLSSRDLSESFCAAMRLPIILSPYALSEQFSKVSLSVSRDSIPSASTARLLRSDLLACSSYMANSNTRRRLAVSFSWSTRWLASSVGQRVRRIAMLDARSWRLASLPAQAATSACDQGSSKWSMICGKNSSCSFVSRNRSSGFWTDSGHGAMSERLANTRSCPSLVICFTTLSRFLRQDYSASSWCAIRGRLLTILFSSLVKCAF